MLNNNYIILFVSDTNHILFLFVFFWLEWSKRPREWLLRRLRSKVSNIKSKNFVQQLLELHSSLFSLELEIRITEDNLKQGARHNYVMRWALELLNSLWNSLVCVTDHISHIYKLLDDPGDPVRLPLLFLLLLCLWQVVGGMRMSSI